MKVKYNGTGVIFSGTNLIYEKVHFWLLFGISREDAVIYHEKTRSGRSMKKKSKKNKDIFLKELESYERAGIPLQLNGMPSTPKKIVKAHKVAEDVTYMRDYVRDTKGRLKSLGFDSVRDPDANES